MLNIDRRFIAGLGVSHDDEVIVRAVLNLAEAFGVDAVAEGVETEDQSNWLGAAGCRLAQGYLFSHPIDAPAAEQLLRGQVATSTLSQPPTGSIAPGVHACC